MVLVMILHAIRSSLNSFAMATGHLAVLCRIK